jgi:hypothetical protein
MIKKIKAGVFEVWHYYRPGKLLDDIAIKKLHSSLIQVNEKSGANIVNIMLDKNASLDEVRDHLQNTIVATLFQGENIYAFVISPILSFEKNPVLHSGLIVVAKNPGIDLISLLALGNLTLGYKNLGRVYTTNISSTPSIIESFTTMVPGSWPNPDAHLKIAPDGYKEVVKILKEEYMDRYFPDAEKLEVNYKRFTLSSNSKEMGFVTDFFKISRSDNFKYMSFCRAWINYEKEEDMIQVGEISFYKYLRMHVLLFKLRNHLKKLPANYESIHPEKKSANSFEKKSA